MACFEPLGLAVYVHNDLPFLTDLGNAYRFQPNATLARAVYEGFGEAMDYFLRAIVWGLFIILMTVVLLAMTSVYYYCLERPCYKRKWKHRPKTMLWGCGLLSIVIVMLCIPMVGVGFWAEVELDESLANFISNTTNLSGDAADVYLRAEQARLFQSAKKNFEAFDSYRQAVRDRPNAMKHWLVTAFLILIALLLVLMIICTVLSPVFETSRPVTVMLAVFFVSTFLTSLLTGVGFAFLIILADICVGLSTITDGLLCMQQEHLEFYCNGGYMYGFVLFGLGCGFIVMFVIIQIFGAFFSGALSGYEKYHRATVVPENSEPTAPEREETQPPEQFFVGGTRYQTGMSSNMYAPQSVLNHENNHRPDSPTRAIVNGPTSSDPPPHYDEVTADESVNNTWRTGASISFQGSEPCNQGNYNEQTGL